MTCSAVSLSVVSRVMNSMKDRKVTYVGFESIEKWTETYLASSSGIDNGKDSLELSFTLKMVKKRAQEKPRKKESVRKVEKERS